MGYHTDFTGRFNCFHADTPELRAFLQTIASGEEAAKGMLADWLMERGDPRGEEVARLISRRSASKISFWRLFAIKPDHIAYLQAFSNTRRMKRDPAIADKFPDPVRHKVGLPIGKEGGYFVAGRGVAGQDRDQSILDYNNPPKGQPGLWCHWKPTEDGTAILWDQGEKFYDYVKWIDYLIAHFLGPWGYVLNGVVKWVGEDRSDRGKIVIKENDVLVEGRDD